MSDNKEVLTVAELDISNQAGEILSSDTRVFNITAVIQTAKDAAVNWSEDRCASMGAALAFYTMFSIAPMVLIALAIAGMVFGEQAARGEILAQLRGLFGQSAGQAVEAMLASASKPGQGLLSAAIGAVLLLVGSTTMMAELKDSLDRIFKSVPDPTNGVWGLLRTRILSFGMVLVLAFLLLVSMIFGAAIAAMQKFWSPAFENFTLLLQVVNLVTGLVLTMVMFAMIYKWMPRVKLAWRDVWMGALCTSILFLAGRTVIGLYIGTTGVGSSYGAAGALVVLLLWVYYSAQIFLYGAQLTSLYAERFGSRKGAKVLRC